MVRQQIISTAITISQTMKNNTNDFKSAEQVLLMAINPPLIGQPKIGRPSMWRYNLRTHNLRPAAHFPPRISLVRRITATAGQTTCPGKLLLVSDKRTSAISNTACRHLSHACFEFLISTLPPIEQLCPGFHVGCLVTHVSYTCWHIHF